MNKQNVKNADPKEQQNINPLFNYKESQDEQDDDIEADCTQVCFVKILNNIRTDKPRLGKEENILFPCMEIGCTFLKILSSHL